VRPIRLELQAFGSYPGKEEVDFEALAHRGLFVVSGDTGTGKTTVFDAMCWALYGSTPGKAAEEIRSHHVGPETRTEVRFTFECDGERYVVTRNPEQQRPAKRGAKLVHEPAGAHLVRITADGTVPVVSGATQVTKHCTELIGLGAEQFQRVVLLPQGEFARFLLADTGEREPLLSRLFGGAVFDAMVEWLRAERDRLRGELGDAERALTEQRNAARTALRRIADSLGVEPAEDLDTADRDRLGRLCEETDAPLGALAAVVERRRELADRQQEALAQARAEADRFDRAQRLRGELEELERTRERIEANARAAERSAAARPVVEAGARRDEARLRADEAAAEAARRCDAVREGFAAIGAEVDPSSATAAVEALREHRSRVERAREALAAVRDARHAREEAVRARIGIDEEITAARTEHERLLARGRELDSRIPELREQAAASTPLARELASLDEALEHRRALDELLREQQKALTALRDATARYEEVFAAFVGTQAPRLAAGLRPGAPCPVCGSTDHPAPAVPAPDEEVVSFESVERAGAARDGAARALQVLEQRTSEHLGALGEHADRPLDELTRRRRDLAARRREAEEATRALAELEVERKQVVEGIAAVAGRLAGLEERARHADELVVTASERLERAEQAATGIDPDEIERQATLLDGLDRLCDGLEACLRNADREATVAAAAAAALEEAIDAGPFDGLDEAQAALLPPEQEEQHRTAARHHREERARAQGALDELEELGVPEERPDVDTLAARAEQARRDHEERAGVLRSATDARRHAAEALAEHDRLLTGSATLREQAETAERAHLVCSSGGPGVSMSLKRWVLTRELDRVAAAANVHLHRMTSGRYTLRRKEERDDQRKRFGLDLEVLDAHTGRARSTTSLSGGEQFQASLALALGLADVVSHGGTSSGKRFEALFVDEGFGSLSAEALDDAVETLVQLQTTGRMVGAITHVEAMKQQLHVGIEVKRRADGAGSTLVVHP
jgi:exonuclease SbcC